MELPIKGIMRPKSIFCIWWLKVINIGYCVQMSSLFNVSSKMRHRSMFKRRILR